MVTIDKPPTEDSVCAFAERWTARLADEDYEGAFAMLCRVDDYPGKSWVASADELHCWIRHYGSLTPLPGEPDHRVTPIASATGERWANDVDLDPMSQRYPGYAGRLDWWLPLNGAWSDLQASFDLIDVGSRIAFVLVALRVP